MNIDIIKIYINQIPRDYIKVAKFHINNKDFFPPIIIFVSIDPPNQFPAEQQISRDTHPKTTLYMYSTDKPCIFSVLNQTLYRA